MPSRQMNGQHRPVAHSRHSTFFNPEGLQQHEAFFNGKQTSSLRPVQRKAQEAPPSKPNNTGLPGHLKSGVENLSGLAMDDVKVHYNSDKPVQLQAAAYTQGTEIHVAPGQEKHLPHEAWHVVQQKQGRVAPTTQLKQTFVNDNEVLEKEADEKGSESLSRGAAPGTDLQAHVIQRVSNTNSGVVQFGKKTKKPSPLEKLIKKDVQYTFTYNRGAIGGNVASSNTTLAATEEDNLLKLVQAKHKELEAMKDYPIGKGKGESYDFNYRGVGIKIRFDKVNRKFYPRVSFEDINDPSTLELEGLMRKYDESSIAQFIMGVRGVVPPAESQNPNKPNKTGLGVRAVLLISDFLDFETNSPLNINFLGKVT
ncbi:MAG TPA: DUF4157 domain-containing protein, partial [Chitinophaga sp.]|uniref:eCIS core domain-containing protein n=1 Tax=Chitinophaga sp. TaxID=1869181 RepID=UPI002C2DF60F